jgi:hypothetical protein
VKKCCIAMVVILALVVSHQAAAQIPEDIAKASAELAARQAEAAERARQKVLEEMRAEMAKAQMERERDRIVKAGQAIPVDVEVMISRYQGDKKVSSLPYALTVNARYQEVRDQHRTILKMGGQVPVPVMAPQAGPDGQPSPNPFVGPVQYKDIGTQIDCAARPMDDGRFELFISVEDTAVATPPPAAGQQATMPALRTFASSNTIVLRDGQTRQFTAAADRITGEIVRVDVTLRVPK